MRILLIEDDVELANGLRRAFAQAGHVCDHLAQGHGAAAAVAVTAYDALVLDLGLPDVDGLDLLAQLRRDGLTAPVLLLTARDGVEDRIRGLDSGADDYLAKPFALGELEARLRALVRRGGSGTPLVQYGALAFDAAAREARVGTRRLELTARELALLGALMQQPGRVVSKQRLYDALYDWHADTGLSVIEVHISRVRRKLEAAHAGVGVRALRGLGYRLEAVARDDAAPDAV